MSAALASPSQEPKDMHAYLLNGLIVVLRIAAFGIAIAWLVEEFRIRGKESDNLILEGRLTEYCQRTRANAKSIQINDVHNDKQLMQALSSCLGLLAPTILGMMLMKFARGTVSQYFDGVWNAFWYPGTKHLGAMLTTIQDLIVITMVFGVLRLQFAGEKSGVIDEVIEVEFTDVLDICILSDQPTRKISSAAVSVLWVAGFFVTGFLGGIARTFMLDCTQGDAREYVRVKMQ